MNLGMCIIRARHVLAVRYKVGEIVCLNGTENAECYAKTLLYQVKVL